MSNHEAMLETFVESASKLIGVEVEPEWREAVKANLAVALSFWERLRDIELPEDIEPAPQFNAFVDEGER